MWGTYGLGMMRWWGFGGGVSESRGEWLGMWVRDGDGVFVGVFLCVRTYIYDPALRDV